MVEDSFDAAHFLRGYTGSCERLHGHTYRVQVFLRSAGLNDLGIAIDCREVKAKLASVLGELDHQFLNDLPIFATTNPSAENIAGHIHQALSRELGCPVFKVTVWETASSAASYIESTAADE